MKPEKPAIPESLVAMWVFIGFAITSFAGYFGARGDGLDWYVSLPLTPGAIPAWAFGPATVLIAIVATGAVHKSRHADGSFNRLVFFALLLALVAYTVAELLLFRGRHAWVPAAILFGGAGLLCLILTGFTVGRAGFAAGLIVLLAIWFAWVGVGTLRMYKADKGTVPSVTVTDVGARS